MWVRGGAGIGLSQSAFVCLNAVGEPSLGQARTTKTLAIGASFAAALLLLALAGWMMLRGGTPTSQPEGIQIIAPESAAELETGDVPPATSTAAAPVDDTAPDRITVYITGEVVNPGVYTVTPGDRLDTVLQLAGGPTHDADLRRINLAAYATDAAHYSIPAAGDPTVVPAPATEPALQTSKELGPSVGCQAPVNINTATAQCLETLPGIGGVRAGSIVAHREQAGPFASPESITDVSGIGEGTYLRIAEMITVGPR